MAYPVENLLRTPVEWFPAGVSFAAAALLAARPGWFFLPQIYAWPTAAGLLLVAGLRVSQALALARYRRNLRRLPDWRISADQIPWSKRMVFLGRGFAWDQRHTQRLADVRKPVNARFRKPTRLYHLARRLELLTEHGPLAGLARLTRADHSLNPVRPLPPVGGDPVLHGVEPNEHDVWMDVGERVGHTVVLGTTRVGKTRFAEILITQDIRRGDVVIVFDPKGDADLLRRVYAEAKRCGREGEFRFFHLGWPEISARYNPVGHFARVTEVATRTAGPLPSEGQSAAFRQFAWRYVNVLARAMVALGQKPSYDSIYQNAANAEGLALAYLESWLNRVSPGWQEDFNPEARAGADKSLQEQAKKTGRSLKAIGMMAYIRDHDLHDPLGDALMSVLSNDRTYFEKLVSSLYPLLEKLTTGKMAELISPDYFNPDDTRSIFDWMQVINQGGIVYVGLDALSDYEVAGVVGNAMFADLTSIAGKIYKFGVGYGQSVGEGGRRISIHADEFNELIGDEFVPLLNKAGGAGFQVTVYTQTWSDVEAKIGNRAKAEQVAGNLNTLLMLRVKNAETAEILTNQLEEVEIVSTTAASQAADENNPLDFTDFTSRNEDRLTSRAVPMLVPADLVKLPKGQAFALIEGGRLMKLRLPLADARDDPMMPENLVKIAAEMAQRYQAAAPAEFGPQGWNKAEDPVDAGGGEPDDAYRGFLAQLGVTVEGRGSGH